MTDLTQEIYKECVFCGEAYKPSGNCQKYCSKECSYKVHRKRKIAWNKKNPERVKKCWKKW